MLYRDISYSLYHSFLGGVVGGNEKCVVKCDASFLREAVEKCVFFCCLFHLSHWWFVAFCLDPSLGEWTECVERWTCVHWLVITVSLFSSVTMLFFLAQVFTPVHTPLTLVQIRRNVQNWVLYLQLHVLPAAFGEIPLYACLENVVVNFVLYIGYFTCVVAFFFYSLWKCAAHFVVGLFYSLLRTEPMLCYTESCQEGKKSTERKRKPDETDRCMFGGKQENCGSCHIVLNLLISPRSANLLRLHLPR